MFSPILGIQADKKFLQTAVNFVQNSCEAFEFEKKVSLSLALATEEIFFYLSHHTQKNLLQITLASKEYYIDVNIECDSKNFNLEAFNLAFDIDDENDSNMNELGILIASRIVDNFTMREVGSKINITLKKYKTYKQFTQLSQNTLVINSFKISKPQEEELKVLVNLMNSNKKDEHLPRFFEFPQMIADIYKAGDMDALIAKEESGSIIGGLFYKAISKNTIELFGPYMYSQNYQENISQELITKALELFAKSSFNGVICRDTNEYFPRNLFEKIGKIGKKDIYYRALYEDKGASSWACEMIEDYLLKEYEKLFLPRNINLINNSDKVSKKSSVITSQIDKISSEVIMRPLIFGDDFDDSLKKHLALFEKEKYDTIFFEVDLGESWHVYFINSLINQDFEPITIIPYGAKGDLLILQKFKSKSIGR